MCKNAKAIKLLINAGANINAKNKFGQTPSDIAKIQGHTAIELMQASQRKCEELREPMDEIEETSRKRQG